GGGGGCSRSC
ncbi:polymorphic outer membrane protein, partial [Chlamydia psittaci 02DC18]